MPGWEAHRATADTQAVGEFDRHELIVPVEDAVDDDPVVFSVITVGADGDRLRPD